MPDHSKYPNRRNERHAISMKDAVKGYLKAQGLEDEYKVKVVLGKWEELVGKPIALRTESLKVLNSILYIKLNSSVMRDELSHRKNQIISIINKEAGYTLIKEVFLT